MGVLFMAFTAKRASLHMPGGSASQCLICFRRSMVLHCQQFHIICIACVSGPKEKPSRAPPLIPGTLWLLCLLSCIQQAASLPCLLSRRAMSPSSRLQSFVTWSQELPPVQASTTPAKQALLNQFLAHRIAFTGSALIQCCIRQSVLQRKASSRDLSPHHCQDCYLTRGLMLRRYLATCAKRTYISLNMSSKIRRGLT